MEIHKDDEFKGVDGIKIVSAKELFNPDYSKPNSKSEEVRQEEIRQAVFRLNLAKIVEEETLEDWELWGFDFVEIAYRKPKVALQYVHWAEKAHELGPQEDHYVNSLRELPLGKLSTLKEFLLPYIESESV